MVLNHSAEGSQIQTYEFLEPHKKNLPQDNWHVLLHKILEVLHKILEVLRKDIAHLNGFFPSKD